MDEQLLAEGEGEAVLAWLTQPKMVPFHRTDSTPYRTDAQDDATVQFFTEQDGREFRILNTTFLRRKTAQAPSPFMN